MEQFLNIFIVGAFLSILIQAVKDKLGVNSLGVKIFTIALSLVVGLVYNYLEQTGLLVTVVGILGNASLIYALLFKKDNS